MRQCNEGRHSRWGVALTIGSGPARELAGRTVFVAGHRGLVGSALLRRLAGESCEILTATRSELDLRNQAATLEWMESRKPDYVLVAAGTVGGIVANDSRPAEFIYDNIAITSNIIHASYLAGVQKLVMLGSSCIYPKFAPQPIAEESLLSGSLEPTNEWYAIAKIAALKMALAYRRQYGCDFISAMPSNLYGPGDNFDLTGSHVLPALIRKFHNGIISGAPSVEVWGTGNVLREFLFVDDCADATVFLLKNYSGDLHVNVGSSTDQTIREAAEIVRDVVGYRGDIHFDTTKPDGTPRKLMDSGRLLGLGWRPQTSLRDGLARTYEWALAHNALG